MKIILLSNLRNKETLTKKKQDEQEGLDEIFQVL